MGKKEEGKKEINLMPENLRSKESGILAKVKSKAEFDLDFVIPKHSSKTKEIKQGFSFAFAQKFKKLFNKPKRFGQSTAKAQKKEKIKDQKEPTLHIPSKQDKKKNNDFKIDYKDSILDVDDDKKNKSAKAESLVKNLDRSGKEQKQEKEKKGLSIWDKLKKLLTSKAKVSKVLKTPADSSNKEIGWEKVPAKVILAQDIEDKKQTKPVSNLPELDKKQIKSASEILAKVDPKPKVQLADKLLVESTSIKEKPIADFSIPAINNLTEPTLVDKPTKETANSKDKKSIPKFHKPQPRIRAKLLDNGGGVDLIPAAAKTRSWKQIINLVLVACLGAAFIVGVFYGFLFYQGQKIEAQKSNRSEQITSLERQILDYEDLNEDITQLGSEIKAIHKLLSFHLYWTNFFQLLEKYTVKEVYYTGLTAGNGGALTLRAIGTDFDSVARQLKVLEQEAANEFVISADISSATYVEDRVEFDMTIVLNPLLFIYNENYIYEIDKPLDEGGGENEGV